ncbi:MAG: hypothetical protein LBH53_00665 [Puniceicoccales bacterium]|nr:hypothetical protein [Puniceicoccales bacterium]
MRLFVVGTNTRRIDVVAAFRCAFETRIIDSYSGECVTVSLLQYLRVYFPVSFGSMLICLLSGKPFTLSIRPELQEGNAEVRQIVVSPARRWSEFLSAAYVDTCPSPLNRLLIMSIAEARLDAIARDFTFLGMMYQFILASVASIIPAPDGKAPYTFREDDPRSIELTAEFMENGQRIAQGVWPLKQEIFRHFLERENVLDSGQIVWVLSQSERIVQALFEGPEAEEHRPYYAYARIANCEVEGEQAVFAKLITRSTGQEQDGVYVRPGFWGRFRALLTDSVSRFPGNKFMVTDECMEKIRALAARPQYSFAITTGTHLLDCVCARVRVHAVGHIDFGLPLCGSERWMFGGEKGDFQLLADAMMQKYVPADGRCIFMTSMENVSRDALEPGHLSLAEFKFAA